MLALIRRPTKRNRCSVVIMAAVIAFGSVPSLTASADATPLVAAARNGSRYHVVQLGETLWQIAVRYGTTVSALVRANGIDNPNLIFPGTRLVVPGGGGSSGGGSGGDGGTPDRGRSGAGWKIHVVKAGDLLWEIAIRYGTTTAALIRANDIPNPDALRIGTRLKVPDDGSGSQGGDGGGAGSERGGGGDGWRIHVVRSGELLWEIALRYGTTAGALIRANDIPNPDALRIGMRLRVPGSGSGDTGGTGRDGGGGGGEAPSGWRVHVVRPGEMLWQIALRYGTTAGALIRANDIPNPDALRIGMRLRVPNGRAQPQTPSIECPVRGAEFDNDFGVPRPGGRVHAGIDLFAPRGTPVRAPASGWVAAWVGDIGGRQIRLIGDDGHYYSSSHLSAFGAGGWVQGGTVIGYVGNTGNAKGSPPHVHFEFHRNGGAAVNPYGMLVRACG